VVWKLADAAQEEVFWLPVQPLLNILHHFLIIAKTFSPPDAPLLAEEVIV
jgi:hypothetical protein